MRALIVARKDYEDAVRSRTLWVLTVLLITFAAGLAFTLEQSDLLRMFWPMIVTILGETEVKSYTFTDFWLLPAKILVPLVGLVISYNSIAGGDRIREHQVPPV